MGIFLRRFVVPIAAWILTFAVAGACGLTVDLRLMLVVFTYYTINAVFSGKQ
jgi:hypothetical protein